jgi:hypothetical protein
VLVHGANDWNATNKGGGWEFPAFWIVALIALFFWLETVRLHCAQRALLQQNNA